MTTVLDQKERCLMIKAPFVKDDALLVQVDGEESLSGEFIYHCEMVSKNYKLDGDACNGQSVGIQFQQPDGRFIHGVVRHFYLDQATPDVMYSTSKSCLRRYRFTLVPKLALLDKTKHFRVFQDKEQTAITLVKKILEYHSIDVDISQVKEPQKRQHTIQYNESDLAFIRRILADAGIFYYFDYTLDSHKMVLANQNTAFKKQKPVELTRLFKSNVPDEIKQWGYVTSLNTAQYTSNDFCSAQPDKKLEASVEVKGQEKHANVEKTLIDYEFPANAETSDAVRQMLGFKVERAEAAIKKYLIIIDQFFLLTQPIKIKGDEFDQKIPGSVVVVKQQCRLADWRGIVGHHDEFILHSELTTIDSALLWRPEKIAPPKVGILKATVVNAKGEVDDSQPFYHDDLGKVAVKFDGEEYKGNTLAANKYNECCTEIRMPCVKQILAVGTKVDVAFPYYNLDRPVIIRADISADFSAKDKVDPYKTSFGPSQGSHAHPFTSVVHYNRKDEQTITMTADHSCIKMDGTKEKQIISATAGEEGSTSVVTIDATKDKHTISAAASETSIKIDGTKGKQVITALVGDIKLEMDAKSGKVLLKAKTIEFDADESFDIKTKTVTLKADDLKITAKTAIKGDTSIKGNLDVS